jgi:hypothetical protein
VDYCDGETRATIARWRSTGEESRGEQRAAAAEQGDEVPAL